MENGSVEIRLKVSKNNEGTAAPWWCIMDPRQMMSPDVHVLAGMIEGPFFSREAAEESLRRRRYAYGKNAAVYCMSGYHSHEYRNACKEVDLT